MAKEPDAQQSGAELSFEISEYAVGPVHLGASVGEAKAKSPNLTFVRGGGPENSIVVDVMQGEKLLMQLFTQEEIEYDDDGKAPPIDDSALITGIDVVDPRFKTVFGLSVGADAKLATRAFGQITKMFNYPHSGETPTYANQPDYIALTLGMPEGSDEYLAGVYTPSETCNEFNPSSCEVAVSTRPGAIISGMWVGFSADKPRTITEITGLPQKMRIMVKGPTAESCESGDNTATYVVWPEFAESGFYDLVEVKGGGGCPDEYQPIERVANDAQDLVKVGDFNFDGVTDLALYNGNNGGYGSMSYNVYFFDESSASYYEDPQFSKLTHSLGMFEVDEIERMLYVSAKSGAAWTQKSGYIVVENEPLKVYERTEEYLPNGMDKKVTIKRMVDGEWTEVSGISEE